MRCASALASTSASRADDGASQKPSNKGPRLRLPRLQKRTGSFRLRDADDDASSATRRFDELPVAARILSASRVECVSPALPAGHHALLVTTNAELSTASAHTVSRRAALVQPMHLPWYAAAAARSAASAAAIASFVSLRRGLPGGCLPSPPPAAESIRCTGRSGTLERPARPPRRGRAGPRMSERSSLQRH